jgi:arylsulfatase A-like enzyme
MLMAGGYRCGMVGKWDMGQAKRYLPLQRGFDFFYGHGNNGIDYYTHERYGVHSMFAGNQRSKADQGTYATDLFERESLKFIRHEYAASNRNPQRQQGTDSNPQRQQGAQPWFLYLCFNAPHGASSFGSNEVANARREAKAAGEQRGKGRPGVQAPDDYVAKYDDLKVAENLKRYYAAVTRMDDAIGAILKLLDETKQLDNTLVIFQSDNGGSGNGGNAPFKGAKSSLWEGGLRVPFVARWPGKIPAGRVSDEFATTLELMPTLAAAAGISTPAGVTLDGYNLLPTLAGDAPSPRKEMFWEFRGQKAARVGNYKWIESERASGLYDLKSDIGEQTDLSTKMPQVADEISAKWKAWRKSMDETEPRGPFRDY